MKPPIPTDRPALRDFDGVAALLQAIADPAACRVLAALKPEPQGTLSLAKRAGLNPGQTTETLYRLGEAGLVLAVTTHFHQLTDRGRDAADAVLRLLV